MKKTIYLLIAIIVLAFSLTQTAAVHAQEECRDATGAVIPCPPAQDPTGGGSDSDDSGSGGGSSGTNPNPPTNITATPSPTSTPLPFADNPTPTPTPLTPQPPNPGIQVTQQPGGIANPTGSGSDSGAASKGCSQADYDDTPGWLVECTAEFVIECASLGGDPTVVTHDEKNTSVYCSVDWGSPTINPIKLTIQRDNDVPPSKPTSKFPPGGWTPWFAGLGGLLIGLLLPAIQKIREAAARSAGPQIREHILLNKDDGDTENSVGGSGKAIFKEFSAKHEEPQEAKKIFIGGLSAKPDPQPAPDFLITLDGIPGVSKDEKPAPEDSVGKDDVISREDKDK